MFRTKKRDPLAAVDEVERAFRAGRETGHAEGRAEVEREYADNVVPGLDALQTQIEQLGRLFERRAKQHDRDNKLNATAIGSLLWHFGVNHISVPLRNFEEDGHFVMHGSDGDGNIHFELLTRQPIPTKGSVVDFMDTVLQSDADLPVCTCGEESDEPEAHSLLCAVSRRNGVGVRHLTPDEQRARDEEPAQ